MSTGPAVTQTVWTGADFAAMGWPDNAVHAVALEPALGCVLAGALEAMGSAFGRPLAESLVPGVLAGGLVAGCRGAAPVWRGRDGISARRWWRWRAMAGLL